jgi:hypothetical protein
MAFVAVNSNPLTLQTGTGTDTYIISNASDGAVGTVMVHLDTTSAGTVSVVVKARPAGIPIGTTTPPFLPIPYLPLCDGGTAGTYGTGSTAALTGDGDLILIPATGLDIALDVTFTDGVHVVRFAKLVGAAS